MMCVTWCCVLDIRYKNFENVQYTLAWVYSSANVYNIITKFEQHF